MDITPVRKRPWRSPLAVVDAVKHIIQGKHVCDIGCGEGDILALMSQYAKKVTGFERDKRRYKHAIRRGIEVVVGDFNADELPDAEVYYTWPDRPHNDDFVIVEKILAKPFPCILLLAGQEDSPYIIKIAKDNQSEIIKVPYDEGEGDRTKGILWIAVVENKGRNDV